MKGITIPTISIPVISMPAIGVPWIGVPDEGRKGLVWPSGMKEAIKAIYDPKKQGMTNYDVIEAYIEDFTTWDNHADRGTATVTQNTIHITETVGPGNIVEGVNPPYANLTVYITGVTEDIYIVVADISGRTEEIKRDGLYTFKNNDHFFGFRVNTYTTCNITIKQLPTSVLQDLSGNGNHAYLYGGKGKLNSGMGVYRLDMKNAENLAFDDFERFANKIIARGSYKGGYSVFGQITDSSNIPIDKTITVRIKGVTNLDYPLVLEYGYFLSTGEYYGNKLYVSQDGIYTYTFKDVVLPEDTAIEYIYFNRCYFAEESLDVNELVIEEIPDYPDYLCYDGKMYAVCYGFPILTDYTVMADRTWFDKEEYSAFISNSLGGIENSSNGAFSIELKALKSFTTMSFGSLTSIGVPEKGITYQTKQSYNGTPIDAGQGKCNELLVLGSRYYYKDNNEVGDCWNGCHGKIIIADRSFTEKEISWLKQNWEKL